MKSLLIAAFSMIFAGCSLKTLALRSTSSLLEAGSTAFHDESDPQLAKEAMGSQLKLLEALLQSEPGNPTLLKLASEGFGGYAFLFLEDDEPGRAKALYLRGRDYALKALARNSALRNLSLQGVSETEKALAHARRTDLPALFWAAFSWAGWINLSKDSAAAIADLPKAVALMRRASELDPSFHFAGPEIFFGVYYASRPAILGGDSTKAKAHFQEARRLTSGKFLMAYVLEARSLAVALQDQEMFKALLSKVLSAEAGALPKARLSDEAAKVKARVLLKKIDEFF